MDKKLYYLEKKKEGVLCDTLKREVALRVKVKALGCRRKKEMVKHSLKDIFLFSRNMSEQWDSE